MIKSIMRSVVCLCVLLSSFYPAIADESVRKATAQDIEQAEHYLQKMKTAQARFVQTTHDGAQLVGTFYLQRPGKLRFEYDPPVENFVVADGVFIYFYDADLEEQTNAPIQSTLANFFLRKNFSLSEDLIVTDARFSDDLLRIEVVQSDDEEAGSIEFAFDKEPFTLKKWRVIDRQGMITEVELFHLKTGIPLDSKLFIYVNPIQKNGKSNYNE